MQPSEPITAIYARQSRKRNSSYSSCDAQVRVCLELANACGFEIREVYVDEGESSESLDRVQMNRLLADARAALKRQGKRVSGRVPFGYVADKLARTLVVHPKQSLNVKELFRLAAQGSKPSDLARHANSCGWKNHRELTVEWTPRWITKLAAVDLEMNRMDTAWSFGSSTGCLDGADKT